VHGSKFKFQPASDLSVDIIVYIFSVHAYMYIHTHIYMNV